MSSAIVESLARPQDVDISQTNVTSPKNLRKRKASRKRTSGSALVGNQNISEIVENVKSPSESSEFTNNVAGRSQPPNI